MSLNPVLFPLCFSLVFAVSTARCASGEVCGSGEVQQSAPAIGDPVADFEAVDDDGQPWKSLDRACGKPLVVFFHPGDFKFCTIRQFQKYKCAMKDLAELGVAVVAVSGDTPETHRLFKAAHGLNFTMLADPDARLASQFGVPTRKGGTTPAIDAEGKPIFDAAGKPMSVQRGITLPHWTFIIGRDGTLLYRNTQVSPLADSQDVVQFIRNLQTDAAIVQSGEKAK